jgi:hypothetical protein
MDPDPRPEKVTLTQLQRFLPLPPPPFPPKLPLAVQRFLGSSSFNNFSLKEQRAIQANYNTVYRSYFDASQIVEHIHSFTNHKFTEESILQALSNSALRHGLVDWYRFVLKVADRLTPVSHLTAEKAAVLLQRKFRGYRAKKQEWRACQGVQMLRQSVE